MLDTFSWTHKHVAFFSDMQTFFVFFPLFFHLFIYNTFILPLNYIDYLDIDCLFNPLYNAHFIVFKKASEQKDSVFSCNQMPQPLEEKAT